MHFDLYCRKCKKKISFDGASLLDMPPCPGCGYVVPKEELEGDNKEVEQFKEFLRKRKSGK